MQYFDRVIDVRLEAPDGRNKTFSYDKNKDKEFAIEFEVDFDKYAKPSTVKLYNVNSNTVDMCKPKGGKQTKIELSAGYGKETKLLIAGNVFESKIKKEETEESKEADTFLELSVTNHKFTYEFDQILSSPFNSFKNQKVSNIVRTLLPVNSINLFDINLKEDISIEKITFNGNLRQALNDLAERANAVINFRRGKLIFEARDALVKRDSPILCFDKLSGLVRTPEPINSGYKVATLLNPAIEWGEIIQLSFKDFGKEIKNKEFKVLTGKHFGGSHITNFFSEFEVIPV